MNNEGDYRDFLPENSTRKRERVEWVQFYSYNARDNEAPRVLVIGDSISCQFKDFLRKQLGDKVNLSSWATSKCVTDPTYLKELGPILEYNEYDLVLFNNGLHSLSMPLDEWGNAYEKALDFIAAKLPDVPIALVYSTPLTSMDKTQISRNLNAVVLKISQKKQLPIVDIFTPMDQLDRDQFWIDEYHFTEQASAMQAEQIAAFLEEYLKDRIASYGKSLTQYGTATGPTGKIQ